MTNAESVSATLSRFVVQTRWEDIPENVRHEAKRALLNWLGCAIGGANDAATMTALKVVAPFSGRPEATLVVHPQRLDALSAAFVNGITANVHAFDDTHLRTVIHPTAPVLPALFALADLRPVLTGAEVLTAYVLGVDVECRIGNAVSPEHYSHGWHITSTCGVIGAAAAAGKAIGLSEEQMLWAIGTGAMQSAGLVENLGTMAKNVTLGNAPRGGIMAALLAEEGFVSCDYPIEGRFGFLNVFSAAPPVISEVTDGLGSTWELMQNSYKPYPSGVVFHPVIDACLELLDGGLKPADIERIVISGAPLLRERGDRPTPSTGREALVSTKHCVAVSLLFGRAGVEEFTDAMVANPAVLAMGERVESIDDLTIPVEAARVTVNTKDGREVSAYVPIARGSLGRPMSDSDIEAKVRGLVAFGAPHLDASRLIDAAWAFDTAPDASALLKLTQA